jgi:hypothetical protein
MGGTRNLKPYHNEVCHVRAVICKNKTKETILKTILDIFIYIQSQKPNTLKQNPGPNLLKTKPQA